MPADILLLSTLLPAQERALEERFTVHRPAGNGEKAAFQRDVAPRIRGVVTGGSTGIGNDLVAQLPALEIVAINGVGFDKVDLELARARGYRVTNTPDVLTDDVADLAIALMLMLSRRLVSADRFVRAGRWLNGEFPLATRASGRRYGILGLGRIGRAIAARLEGFGGEIAYCTRTPVSDVPYAYHDTVAGLAAASDVLIVAANASPSTRHIVDAAVLDALGPTGALVNIARGSLVDEHALIDALIEGRIAGAGLDVFEAEPKVPQALINLSNVVLAPHVGSATAETRGAMGDLVLANLDAHFAGKPLPTPVV